MSCIALCQLERNRDGRYTQDVRSARSVDEARSRGHAGAGNHIERQPASGQTNRIAESAAPIQPATTRAVPFVHPSRLVALGAAAGGALPSVSDCRKDIWFTQLIVHLFVLLLVSTSAKSYVWSSASSRPARADGCSRSTSTRGAE